MIHGDTCLRKDISEHFRSSKGRDLLSVEQPGESSERGGTWLGLCGFGRGLPGRQA